MSMIPTWIFDLMLEDRFRSKMSKDEHGEDIKEPQEAQQGDRAFPGYIDYLQKKLTSYQPRSSR